MIKNLAKSGKRKWSVSIKKKMVAQRARRFVFLSFMKAPSVEHRV